MRNKLLITAMLLGVVGCAGVHQLSQTPTEDEQRAAASRQKIAQMRQETYGDKTPKPEFPAEAEAFWASLHETDGDATPAELNHQARLEIEAEEANRSLLSSTLSNVTFETWGPGNFGGRLRGLVVHPTRPNELLVGSVSGGIFKSVDSGASWNEVDDFLPNLAIGSMLIDPDNAERVYAGTGEGFFNFGLARGLGIYVSDDFGDTWTVLASTTNSDFFFVNRIARVEGSNILMAATSTGIWRSTDLGVSWNEASMYGVSSRGFVDLKADPSSSSRFYAYHYGGSAASRLVFRSNNNGASWSQLTAAQGVPDTDISRMEIAVGTDGVVYLAVSNNATQTRGLWRSPAGGNAFVKTTSNTAFIERQGWYDLLLGVDPFDSDNVYMAAVDLFRTENAGTTITKQTFWNPNAGQVPNYVHADQHVIAFHPTDQGTFYVGTDGGVFRTTDGGDTFEDLNNDLRVAQYYGIAAPPDGSSVIGGTQDNGTHIFSGDNAIWLQWFGGDGGYCAWDQQQTDFVYGSLPGGGLFGSSDRALSATQIGLPNTAGARFINPFAISPTDGNRMIVGTDNLFYTGNIRAFGGATWTDVTGTIGTLSATAFSPIDATVAYGGTQGGAIYEVTDLGGAPISTRIDNGTPAGADVNWIEVDRHDVTGDTIYAAFADYGADRVWKTIDGGISWTSIHGNLPDIPMFSIVTDPVEPNRLWLGSEMGLFTTTSNTEVEGPFFWERYDYGPAWTRLTSLQWSGDDTLWIGTYGRSIYRAVRGAAGVRLGELDDSLSCDPDGVLDAGETADLPVNVTNRGGLAMTGVNVSLASSYPSLNVLTGTQALGTINPGDTGVATFQVELTDSGTCIDTAELTATVADDVETTDRTVSLVVRATPDEQTGTFGEDAEDDPTPMTTMAVIADDDWTQTAAQANSGSRSWFAADVGTFADKSLSTPWLDVGGGTTVLSFALYYNMEGDPSQYWDGAVLELRTEGGDWIDIGDLSTVPYDGPLFINNTIPAQPAWSGNQSTWRDATVDLGSTYNGQRIQIRWRVVCDTGTGGDGFYVDDIEVTNVSWTESLVCQPTGCNGIFADDFETGDVSAWTFSVP